MAEFRNVIVLIICSIIESRATSSLLFSKNTYFCKEETQTHHHVIKSSDRNHQTR